MNKKNKKMRLSWVPLCEEYEPLAVGSIDGTDTTPHDKAVTRALKADYQPNPFLPNDPACTVFVARLHPNTDEQTIEDVFSRCGSIISCSLVRDIVTGHSKQYAFVEYSSEKEASNAYNDLHNTVIDGKPILVDRELQRTLPGWVPRRLGGGFGGRKESGQLRFGCRDRPFLKPFRWDLKSSNTDQRNNRDRGYHDSRRDERHFRRDYERSPGRRRELREEFQSRKRDERRSRFDDEERRSHRQRHDSEENYHRSKRYSRERSSRPDSYEAKSYGSRPSPEERRERRHKNDSYRWESNRKDRSYSRTESYPDRSTRDSGDVEFSLSRRSSKERSHRSRSDSFENDRSRSRKDRRLHRSKRDSSDSEISCSSNEDDRRQSRKKSKSSRLNEKHSWDSEEDGKESSSKQVSKDRDYKHKKEKKRKRKRHRKKDSSISD